MCPTMEAPKPDLNAGKLGGHLLEDVDLCRAVVDLIVIGRSFDVVAVGAVSLDFSWAGAVSPGAVGAFVDFTDRFGECGGEPAGGKIPPGSGPGGGSRDSYE